MAKKADGDHLLRRVLGKQNANLASHESRESVIAFVVTITLHASFLSLLLANQSPGALRADAATGDGSFVVDFVAISPKAPLKKTTIEKPSTRLLQTRPLPTNSRPSQQQDEEESKSMVVRESAENADIRTEPAKHKERFASSTPPAVAASASNALGSAGQSSPSSGYLEAIKQAISVRWTTLHPDQKLPACTLLIEQSVGGYVTTTQASDCVLDLNQRQALEAAALMAQPLPYIGYEQSFSATIKVAF